MAPLVKQLTEAALEGELDSHLAHDVAGNRRSGKSKKKVKSTSGEFELETPPDRTGTFEPPLGPYPGIEEGLRGMRFVEAAVNSAPAICAPTNMPRP